MRNITSVRVVILPVPSAESAHANE